ncbi:DNase Mf2, partial [Streptococcus pyogenes]
GHLVGYQFCGLNDEPRNLVTMTAWLNTGAYSGANDSNPEGMLYYENRLDSWLALHPDFWLDYKVTPIYSGNEVVPRQIELQYVGIDSSGELLTIRLNSNKESIDENGVTTVILENSAPNINLDYLNGTATPKN